MAVRNGTDQKARIRREATRLFAKQGYEATGIQELSEAVGLGRGALYHHIGSKQRLLYDVIATHLDELVVAGEALLDAPISAEDKVRRLSRLILQTIVDDVAAWKVFMHDFGALKGKLRADMIAQRARFERIWVDIVEQGVREGDFRELDRVAMMAILGAHNYAPVWLKARGRLSPGEISDTFCDLLLAGLRR